jgi:hypothetical protein
MRMQHCHAVVCVCLAIGKPRASGGWGGGGGNPRPLTKDVWTPRPTLQTASQVVSRMGKAPDKEEPLKCIEGPTSIQRAPLQPQASRNASACRPSESSSVATRGGLATGYGLDDRGQRMFTSPYRRDRLRGPQSAVGSATATRI